MPAKERKDEYQQQHTLQQMPIEERSGLYQNCKVCPWKISRKADHLSIYLGNLYSPASGNYGTQRCNQPRPGPKKAPDVHDKCHIGA